MPDEKHEVKFASYDSEIVDISNYIFSIEDINDSLKFEYYTQDDSVVIIKGTLNVNDSLPLLHDSELVDTVQFKINWEIENAYKFQHVDTTYNLNSAVYWHKEYGLLAQINYSWDVRFILLEFDDFSLNDLHMKLRHDSVWIDSPSN